MRRHYDERMGRHKTRRSGAIPVSPTLEEEEETFLPEPAPPPATVVVDSRTMLVTALAIGVAIGAGVIAELLKGLIALITNISFYHRVAFTQVSPAAAHAGAWVLVVPVVGALIVGVMARYGSA